MSCDQCHEREAVIHLTQIVNEQVTTLHLCERCAAEKGVESTGSVEQNPFAKLVAASMGKPAPELALVGAGGRGACPRCGATLQDFRESGRLGCADCWRAFEARSGICCGGSRLDRHSERYANGPGSRSGPRRGSTAVPPCGRRTSGSSSDSPSRPRTSSWRPSCGTGSGYSNDRSEPAYRRRGRLARRQRAGEPSGALDPDPAGAKPRRPRFSHSQLGTGGSRSSTGCTGRPGHGAVPACGHFPARRPGPDRPPVAARAAPGEQGAGRPRCQRSGSERGRRCWYRTASA